MTLKPGQETTLFVEYTMPAGMGGSHRFDIHLATNDPQQPEMVVSALSNWVQ